MTHVEFGSLVSTSVIQSHSNNHMFIHSSRDKYHKDQEFKSLTLGWLPCPSLCLIPFIPSKPMS